MFNVLYLLLAMVFVCVWFRHKVRAQSTLLEMSVGNSTGSAPARELAMAQPASASASASQIKASRIRGNLEKGAKSSNITKCHPCK